MSAALSPVLDDVHTALRLAREMDRQADLLLSLGRIRQAERLSHGAAELRAVVQ